MSLELVRLQSGKLAFLTKAENLEPIRAVEYYSDQNYLQLCYENPVLEPQLITEELSERAITAIECAPDNLTVIHILGKGIQSYDVPFYHIPN